MNSPGENLLKLATVIGGQIFIVLVAVAAIVILGYLLGWKADVVLSGSMEPAVQVGGLVVVRPIAPADIHVGDILVYTISSGKATVCHRVVSIATDPSLRFTTRGDANRYADPDAVMPGQVQGIVCFSIPYLGLVLQFVKSPLFLGGIIALIGFTVIVFRGIGPGEKSK